jgi:RNA polymerase sigma factor (sigma-70 family)
LDTGKTLFFYINFMKPEISSINNVHYGREEGGAIKLNIRGMYSEDADHYPRISVEEEKKFGAVILDAKQAKRELYAGNGTISPEEKETLEERIIQGRIARNKLVTGNLRLVLSMADNYCAYNPELSPLDLVQEGNLGLMRAAEKFDHCRGYRFSTYATWWIRQAIMASIRDDRLIRIPPEVYLALNRLKKDKNSPMRPALMEKVDIAERLQHVASLNEAVEDGEGELGEGELGETIPDGKTLVEDEVLDKLIREQVVSKIRAWLEPEEAEVVLLHCGLIGERWLTYSEIDSKLSLSNGQKAEPMIQKIFKSLRLSRQYGYTISPKGLYELLTHPIEDIQPENGLEPLFASSF